MSPIELATMLLQNPTPDLLEINLYNVQELVQTIAALKKELYEKQRDIDVLYFELQNYKPDEDDSSNAQQDAIDIF